MILVAICGRARPKPSLTAMETMTLRMCGWGVPEHPVSKETQRDLETLGRRVIHTILPNTQQTYVDFARAFVLPEPRRTVLPVTLDDCRFTMNLVFEGDRVQAQNSKGIVRTLNLADISPTAPPVGLRLPDICLPYLNGHAVQPIIAIEPEISDKGCFPDLKARAAIAGIVEAATPEHRAAIFRGDVLPGMTPEEVAVSRRLYPLWLEAQEHRQEGGG